MVQIKRVLGPARLRPVRFFRFVPSRVSARGFPSFAIAFLSAPSSRFLLRALLAGRSLRAPGCSGVGGVFSAPSMALVSWWLSRAGLAGALFAVTAACSRIPVSRGWFLGAGARVFCFGAPLPSPSVLPIRGCFPLVFSAYSLGGAPGLRAWSPRLRWPTSRESGLRVLACGISKSWFRPFSCKMHTNPNGARGAPELLANRSSVVHTVCSNGPGFVVV